MLPPPAAAHRLPAVSSFARLAARHFQILLGAAGLEAPSAPLLWAYVLANFLALVLPSALLSDIYRVVDARRDTRRSLDIIAMVTAERIASRADECGWHEAARVFRGKRRLQRLTWPAGVVLFAEPGRGRVPGQTGRARGAARAPSISVYSVHSARRAGTGSGTSPPDGGEVLP